METNTKNLIGNIPSEVLFVTKALEGAGFSAYLVGGCVRDLVIGIKPKDWDVTTNAKPEQIIALFEKTVYENNFGTVAVCVPVRSVTKEGVPHETKIDENEGVSRETSLENVTHETKYEIIEVTPYRTETTYSDFRHPDTVNFS